MSKSYRKNPICWYEKEDLHILNRITRRKRKDINYDIGNHGFYRKTVKAFCWSASYTTLKDFIQDWYVEFQHYDTKEECINEYQKWFIRK